MHSMHSGLIFSLSFMLAAMGSSIAQGQSSSNELLAAQAKQILQTYCHECHGANPADLEAGLNILDYDLLLKDFMIVPGSAKFSYLYERIIKGEMPPAEQDLRPSASEIRILENWIDNGAPSFLGNAIDVGFVSFGQILSDILADIEQMEEIVQGSTRYINANHLALAGASEQEITFAISALDKTLNSLSVNAKVSQVTKINSKALIYRVQLEDYGWLPNSWKRLERIYPFRDMFDIDDPTYRRIRQKTGASIPVFNLDWFVNEAVSPKTYHALLYNDLFGLPSPANATAFLEEYLGIDRIGNVLDGRIVRAGFVNSGVSQNNRIIERHDIGRYTGGYWISYDFASNTDDPNLRHNIFRFPLGPAEAFPGFDNTFKPSGGEVIFNLPNGFQAYLIVDDVDNRLEKAPINIVADPNQPDQSVTTAISCFGCHSQGMIIKRDQLFEYIEANEFLFNDFLAPLYEQYQEPSSFQNLQRGDLERFLAASESAGVDIRGDEPVSSVYHQFERPITLKRLAAELILPENVLRELIQQNQTLNEKLAVLLVSGGQIKRDYMLEHVQVIVRAARPTVLLQ